MTLQLKRGGPHLIGLYVNLGTLPAAILLALRMTSPLWWLLPVAIVGLVGTHLYHLREARRETRRASAPPESAAH